MTARPIIPPAIGERVVYIHQPTAARARRTGVVTRHIPEHQSIEVRRDDTATLAIVHLNNVQTIAGIAQVQLTWRGVLAGAYPFADPKSFRRHLVDPAQPHPQPALCDRVRPENLNDDSHAPLSGTTPCKACHRKAAALPGGFSIS